MKNLKFLITVYFLITGFGAAAFSQHTHLYNDFNLAQKIYEKALVKRGADRQMEMLKAAGIFLKLVETENIENGYLYYNIGNCFFEAGQKGKALLYYEKARRFIPGYNDLKANTEQVKRELRLSAPPQKWYDSLKESLFFWHYMIGFSTKQVLFFTIFSLFWVLLLIGFFIKHLFVRALIILSLVGIVLTGASYTVEYYENFIKKHGVVISHSTETRKGPGLSYEKFYEQNLPEGTSFIVLEEIEDWVKVEIYSGDQFWVEKYQVGMI